MNKDSASDSEIDDKENSSDSDDISVINVISLEKEKISVTNSESDDEEEGEVLFMPRDETSDVDVLQSDKEETGVIEVSDQNCFRQTKSSGKTKSKKLQSDHNFQW